MRLDIKDSKRKAFQELYVSRIDPPDATTKIAFANCLVFVVQSFNWQLNYHLKSTLYSYGSLIPDLVIEGDWWRIISYAFLHIGKVHLLFNVVMLLVLGALIEPILGKTRFYFGYLFCTLGTSAIATFISLNLAQGNLFYLGASGAIMGLFGILIIFTIDGLKRSRTNQLLFNFLITDLYAFVVLLTAQSLSDLYFDEVGIIGHLGGFFSGMLYATYLLKCDRKFRIVR